MNISALSTAAVAFVLASSAQIANAATFDAFAAVSISLATNDGTNALTTYIRQSAAPVDQIDGDGVLTRNLTPVTSGPVGVPVFTSALRVEARATATVDGFAAQVFEVRERFVVQRRANEDREIAITLAPLDGLGGLFLQVFGQSQAPGDIGSGSASVTLEQSGFEGTLFFQSVFANLVGVEPPDFSNAQANLVPTTIDALVPMQNGGSIDTVFTLTYRLETTALAEPQGGQPPVGVIPLPATGFLLLGALGGFGGLAGLRARQRRRAT